MQLAYVDQGDPGERVAHAPQAHRIKLEAVTLQEVKRGFGLLPRRWGANGRSAGPRDYERLAATLSGYHWLWFVLLMLKTFTLKNHDRL